MIPRYRPTYTLDDLFVSLHLMKDQGLSDKLSATLANLFSVKHVFLFSTARSALYVLLRAYNKPGNVNIPAYNCIAVPEVITCANYTPIFLDISQDSVNTDFIQNKEPFSVVIPTYQFGIPFEIDKLVENAHSKNALVVEDAAAALGSKINGTFVGTRGDAGILSFGRTKIITGVGGGALLTNNDELAKKIQEIKLNQTAISNSKSILEALIWLISTQKSIYPFFRFMYSFFKKESLFTIEYPKVLGANTYLKPINKFQTALILVQLSKLSENLSRRQKIASVYQTELSTNKYYRKVTYNNTLSSPAWLQYPIFAENKEILFYYMLKNKIDLSWTFKYSCPQGYGLENYSNSNFAASSILGLPTYPSLSDYEVDFIIKQLKSYEPK